MAESPMVGFLLYSHVIPIILAFIGVIFLATGIMDRKNVFTALGALLFLAAGTLPFIILPFVLGV